MRLTEFFSSARLRVPEAPDQRLRIEIVVSIARLFIAGLTAAVVFVDVSSRSTYSNLVFVLLTLYFVFSASVTILLRSRNKVTRGFVLYVHAIDLLNAATLTLATHGPSSPLFAFFIYVLLAAAFRWGFWETLLSAVLATLLLFLEAGALNNNPTLFGALASGFNFGDLVARTGYLTIMGLLLGYLAEETKQLRSETAAVADLQSKLLVDQGLTPTLELLGVEMRHIFRASRVVLTMEDLANGRLFRWDTKDGWAEDPNRSTGDLPAAERETFWFGPADQGMYAIRHKARDHHHYDIIAIDGPGHTVSAEGWKIPTAFEQAYPFQRLIHVPFSFAGEWSSRVFLLNPSVDVQPAALLRFVRLLSRQVGPAVFNVYLLGRLRARASSIERARVARELHDGVLQSLLAAELELAALRRRAPGADNIDVDLERIQTNIHQEVLSLRDLLQAMQPVAIRPNELPDFLADLVERFQGQTGVTARFVTDLEDITLPPRICRELVRIVQEGLVNVRKHGAAKNVLVRLSAKDSQVKLEIDDDGRGFPFAGRLSHTQLDAMRRGPLVIKERVRSIGGELTIDSAPGRGSTLQVTVPQETRD